MNKKQLETQLLSDDIKLAETIGDAIFMFDNGVLVSGEFCDGVRGNDHNIIIGELPSSSSYEELHQHYAVARLVPETKTALVSGLQLSPSSIKQLTNYGYTIEKY